MLTNNNEQKEGCKINVDNVTTVKCVNCWWWPCQNPILDNKKVNIVIYKGEVTGVICPFFKKGECISSGKPSGQNKCYVLGT